MGAGILNEGNAALTNVTITGNSAASQGGGIYHDTTPAPPPTSLAGDTGAQSLPGAALSARDLTVTNSIVANNYGSITGSWRISGSGCAPVVGSLAGPTGVTVVAG